FHSSDFETPQPQSRNRRNGNLKSEIRNLKSERPIIFSQFGGLPPSTAAEPPAPSHCHQGSDTARVSRSKLGDTQSPCCSGCRQTASHPFRRRLFRDSAG